MVKIIGLMSGTSLDGLDICYTQFDLENGIWLIPAHRMKMRQEHMIPLTEKPLAILKGLYDSRTNDEYVFKKKNKPWEHMPIETPLAAIKRAAGAGKGLHAPGTEARIQCGMACCPRCTTGEDPC